MGIGLANIVYWSTGGVTSLNPVNSIAPEISGTIQRGQTLSTTDGTWSNGTIIFSYQWKRGGVDIGSATSNTYTLVTDDDNDFITCNVTATNDAGATSKISNTLGLVLAAPLLLTSPVASGTAQLGQTLSTTDGTWQGIATIAFTYQWRRDASNIGGATSSAYTLVAADYTTDVDCVVTATNGLGNASADSNDILNIAGTAPVITSLPTISGTIEVLQTITATLSSVTGIPTPSSTLQWQISDNGVSGWSNIVGATSTTYAIALADDDKYLGVVQTATNAEGSDSANSASTIQVAGSAPVISGVPTISSQTQVGEVITATAASVSGVPTPTTAFQWQRSANGSTGFSNISGATSNTYTLVLADDDKYIRAVQTSTNAISTDSANSAASAQISDVTVFTGLLDTYSGATAAYSLRQLSSSYSGNAVRVRRASDNTEQDIGFVNNELDTTSLETFCSGTDGFVTTWYDQSGNASNFSSATAIAQPQIVSSGTSLGYIQLLGSTILNSTASYINGTNYSTFFVGRRGAIGSAIWGTDQSGSFYAVGKANSGNVAAGGFSEGNRYSNGSLIGATWDDMYNALSSFAQVTALVQKQGSNSNIRIGFNNYNNGRHKEYIIYPNQTISRTGVETNIIDHYNF